MVMDSKGLALVVSLVAAISLFAAFPSRQALMSPGIRNPRMAVNSPVRIKSFSPPRGSGAGFLNLAKSTRCSSPRQSLHVRAMDMERTPNTQNAAGEEKEGEEDLMDAISKSMPPQTDGTNLDNLGQDLYMEWMLQAVNTLTVKVSNSPLNDLKLWLWEKAAGEYDKAAMEKEVNDILTSAPVVVIGASYSPFTQKALATLDKAGAKYKYVGVENMGDNGIKIRAFIAKKTGRTSLPSIWAGTKFIGGCFDGPVDGVASMSSEG